MGETAMARSGTYARWQLLRGLLVGCAAGALIPVPAAAQDTQAETTANGRTTNNSEIIVTATKRATAIVDVPFSINAQTQEDIQRSGANTIEDLSRNVAGLTVQNLGPGQSQVSVRGVSAGQIVRDQPGVKEQVGVYLDESVISLSLFTPDFDLFDLNRVETLRGPQGTLFGSGSVGGTLRYITNQPRLDTVEGQVEANVNMLDEDDFGYHLKGAINLPMGDNAAVRIVGYGTKYAGFVDAIGPAAEENINDGSRIGGRVSVLFEPTADIQITPRVVYQEIKTDGFNRQDAYHLYYNRFNGTQESFGEREQYLLLKEGFRDETLLADLAIEVGLGAIQLTSITSYTDRSILVSRDASALTGSVTVDPLLGAGVNPAAVLLPSNLRDTTELEQWAQEVRMASNNDSPFQWVLGGFYSDTKRIYEQRLPTPGYDAFIEAALPGATAATANGVAPPDNPYSADIPYDIEQKAVFGEASYDFGLLTLTAGGRYYDFKESRDFISGGVFANNDTRIGDTTSSNGFSPRLILSYEPTPDMSFNVQASKGFRLGGVNDPLNIPLCQGGANGPDAQTYGNRPTYDDETLWNYEAGVKYFGDIFTLNAAAFYTDISNLQVTADAGSCSSRIVFNVPSAHTKGVEVELGAEVMPGLELSVAGSLIEAEFDSTVTSAGGAVIAGIREGNRLPTVPKFQIAATAAYTQPTSFGEWFANATFQHVGSRYTQASDQEPGASTFNFIHFDPRTLADGITTADFGSLKLPDYQLINLSVGLGWENGLEASLYVNNLLDENTLLSLDRERGGRGRLAYNIGQPRTVGVTVRKSF
jgi:outer membrane receptor protein involved in Fe transport